MEFTHKPVLLAECIEALHIRPEGIYVDGTLGRAGHSRPYRPDAAGHSLRNNKA